MSARSHVDEDGEEGDVVLVKRPIDTKELARLYVDERLPAEEVAKRIGCSETTVRRRLHSQALNVRSRGPRQREPATVGWTRERAYAVGLLATDGNLSRDGRLRANVRPVGPRGRCCRGQWSDRRLYEWVESIGLSPAKSRTLGALTIPDEYFADFARGCIDGDGSIGVYVDRYHSDRNARYVYERLYVTLVSAGRPFVDWFGASVLRFVGIRGSISERNVTGGPPLLGASLCAA